MAKKRRAAEPDQQQRKEAQEPSGSDGEASGSQEAGESSGPSSGSGEGSSSGGGTGDSGDSSDDGSSAPEVSDDDAQSEDDEDGDAFEEVNVDFQFFDPKEIDFHGLKALLHTYLDGGVYDGSGLAEAIIAQVRAWARVRVSLSGGRWCWVAAPPGFGCLIGAHPVRVGR
jgi:protein BCP1